MQIPTSCIGVPAELLNPRLTWADKSAYDSKATDLASRFIKNFAQYADGASKDILSAAPSLPEIA